MQAGERVARHGMVELSNVDHLPICGIVALRAIWAQAALVLILVARRARLRNAQECAIQVFNFDRHTFKCRNSRSGVALVTGQGCVLAFKRISSLPVIERFDVPLDQRKIFAVMLRMATGTFLT
jgi:hypothetical protein